MGKLGLVAEGGGMRGIYGTGVLDTFLRAGLRFDYAIAVSSGAANMASFLSEQPMRNYRFYTQYAMDRRYMSLRNFLKTGSFFGMDFIYDRLTNEIDPVDYDTLLNTKTELRVVATDAQTAAPVYFDNSAITRGDCRVLKASCAIPLFCRPVEVAGTLYFDGGVADPIPVKKAVAEGCDRLVAILTKPRGYEKKPESLRRVYSRALRHYPAIVHALDERHRVYMESLAFLRGLERQGKARILAPSSKIRANVATKKKDVLEALYEMGMRDAEELLQSLDWRPGHDPG
jgi:predicted patatin/cPLA2 family phospholipase